MEGQCRICVHFMPLKKISTKQKIRMQRIDGNVHILQGSAVYLISDSANCFLEIPIHPDGMQKSAFRICTSKIGYTCMPFGMVSALVEMQRHVNHVFSKHFNK